MSKCYEELCRFDTFEERFNYLKLTGAVGGATFGYDRYINQLLYRSTEWRRARDEVIIRDNGCDLGILERPIHYRVLIHHMNPLTVEDIEHGRQVVFDPRGLITTCSVTHNAIHYGDFQSIPQLSPERRSGDTRLW